jgi:hypothetical protein
MGSTPAKKVGVITAPLPAEPEAGVRVIVGADVKPVPLVAIATVAIAPPETVYVPVKDDPAPPLNPSVPLPTYPVPAVVIVSVSIPPFLVI